MEVNRATRTTWSTRTPLRIGGIALALFIGVTLVWGSFTSISGAVIANGTVKVSSTKTALQHRKGGVVAEVLVENGDVVSANDVLLRLDDAQLRWEQKIIEGELFEILANSSRLRAEIDDQRDIITHPLLEEAQLLNSEVEVMLARQKRQLLSHYESLAAQDSLLNQQTKQVQSQIQGARAQVDAKRQQQELVEGELSRIDSVKTEGLYTNAQIQTLQKEIMKVRGETGALTADIAELEGKILELELMRQNLSPKAKELAVDKLNLFRRATSKLLEQRNSLLADLAQLEIRSPISGIVHDLKIQGLRSVVLPATPLMYIVPDDRPITLSAQVEIYDIDQVYRGQEALVKFTALRSRSMLNTYGEVTKISADALVDAKSKKYYYEVEIYLPKEELDKLGENLLVSGMPAVIYLTTMSRSPAQYIARPIVDYLERALRD